MILFFKGASYTKSCISPDLVYNQRREVKTVHILYADRRIAVAVKPAGVLSVGDGMPALLRRELGTECFRTVHRLDAPVSGLMVFARSAAAASLLSRQIREGTFQKEYLALVCGAPPESGALRDLLGRDKTRGLTFVADAPGKDVRPAALEYERLDSCKGVSLVRVRLITGRTHQIRVQFASRGFPILGDGRYGTAADFPIALWSYHLAFRHPESGEVMDFRLPPEPAPPWGDFADALASL